MSEETGRWRTLGAACGVVVSLVGAAALAGWFAGSSTLKSFSPGFSQMKANTALGFVLAGAALLLLSIERRRAGRAMAVAVGLLGLATLTEHVFGWRLGIDELLVDDPAAAAGTPAAGRMGANTALCFTVVGASLLSLDTIARGVRPAQAGAAVIGMVAMVAVLGYVFDVPRLERGFVSRQITPMAVQTALAFLLLAAGLVLVRPAAGIVGLLRAPGAGGLLLRRAVVPAIVLPVALGYARLEGQRHGLYGTEEGLALYATSLVVAFSALLWITARSLERLDVARGESAARERAVVEAALDAFITIDPDGRIVDFSPVAEELFGHPRAQAIGADLADLIIPPQLRERHRRMLARRVAGGGGRGKVRLETTARRADGSEFPAEVVVCVLEGHGAAAFAGNVRDISDRQRLEQQLRQAQKMEAVGQLAGGVAHDFNNLLTVIGGYTTMARDRIGVGPGADELSEVGRACERATQLTQQLLAFSRQQVLDPVVLDLNEVIRSMAAMLSRLIGEDVEIATLADPGLEPVLADRGQIEQVIVNLAVNARDAMPAGGTLTIETKMADRGADGGYVSLVVSDTGTGMDAETATHIFEPFFTTKAVGHGTGLGLATVHGIVTQSGGTVEVHSEPGLGTRFTVYLPALREAEEAAPTPEHGGQLQPPSGSETILVCEDDESVRTLIEHVLTQHGYTVLLAARPSHALRIAATHRGSIAALLSDVVMPDMPGPELAERLQAQRPGLRTVFVSGYTAQVIRDRGQLPAGSVFLEKPFQAASLLRALRALLDTQTPSSAR